MQGQATSALTSAPSWRIQETIRGIASRAVVSVWSISSFELGPRYIASTDLEMRPFIPSRQITTFEELSRPRLGGGLALSSSKGEAAVRSDRDGRFYLGGHASGEWMACNRQLGNSPGSGDCLGPFP